MKRLLFLISCYILLLQSNAQQSYTNPVIPGFHPDPSICRVGEDYYLVTSSFEFFPGVPVFHSKDLVNWELIGHCLNRKSQLNLEKAWCSGGIYAPTIRYNRGVFYMITTNVSHGGNFIVTTTDPAGEWSEPVWVDQGGIDPSLFFDDNGKVYFTGNGPDGIYQFEIDVTNGKKLTVPKMIWAGTGGRYPEGPHLYKINNWYYLMIAEGGTEYGHMEVISRSKSPWGPFESCPHNPILSHRALRGQSNPIQGTGHADLVQDQSGNWWLVFLGFRPVAGMWHQLGRETFLSPVRWKDEWPVVGDHGIVNIQMEAPLPATPGHRAAISTDEFTSNALAADWNYIRNPEMTNYSLKKTPGWLNLKGSSFTLDSVASPTFIGRRQEEFNTECTVKLKMMAHSKAGQIGLTGFMSNSNYYAIMAEPGNDGNLKISLKARLGEILAPISTAESRSGDLWFRINSTATRYVFSWSTDGLNFSNMGSLDSKYLSSEVAGGFTGVYYGVFAVGDCEAEVDWFKYVNLDKK